MWVVERPRRALPFERRTSGRQIRSVDPDKGAATVTYDDDRPGSAVDARGARIFTSYDILGRPTSRNLNTADGTQLATYEYDTLLPGQPTASTSWVDGKPWRQETGRRRHLGDQHPGRRTRNPVLHARLPAPPDPGPDRHRHDHDPARAVRPRNRRLHQRRTPAGQDRRLRAIAGAAAVAARGLTAGLGCVIIAGAMTGALVGTPTFLVIDKTYGHQTTGAEAVNYLAKNSVAGGFQGAFRSVTKVSPISYVATRIGHAFDGSSSPPKIPDPSGIWGE